MRGGSRGGGSPGRARGRAQEEAAEDEEAGTAKEDEAEKTGAEAEEKDAEATGLRERGVQGVLRQVNRSSQVPVLVRQTSFSAGVRARLALLARAGRWSGGVEVTQCARFC